MERKEEGHSRGVVAGVAAGVAASALAAAVAWRGTAAAAAQPRIQSS